MGQTVHWQALIASNWLSAPASVLTRNWPNGSLIFPCFISIPFIRPRNRIAFAVDNRLAFIQSNHPRESLSVPIACKLYLSRLSESKISKKMVRFLFYFCPRNHVSISVIVHACRITLLILLFQYSCNWTACDKLQIIFLTDVRKNTVREARTRAATLFLSDLFYGSGGIYSTEACHFCRVNVGSGKRRQKYFLGRFAEVLLLCRAIVTPNRKLALYILIYRVSTSCVKFLSFFKWILSVCLYIFIYCQCTSSIFFITTLHQNGI